MNFPQSAQLLPAPCIIDIGLLVNKDDMYRLLDDLERVRYCYTLDSEVQSEGEGWVLEVFADAQQATIVANQSLYLNVQSFDYLKLRKEAQQTIIELVHESRCLTLYPLNSVFPALDDPAALEIARLDALVSQVLTNPPGTFPDLDD
ncbi:MAG: hypothetical protein VKK07_06150 [Merismopediaceae bacterium]|nr:hypothetical protein [Merismopediaceae bacterium]